MSGEEQQMTGGPHVGRRAFLGAASAFALSGVGVAVSPAPALAVRGDRFPYRMAMHLHACFSEGDGSMQAHLQQAVDTGVDVVWWTEHDHRMVARNYLTTVHFNGLTETTDGARVVWRSTTEGSLSQSSATIVTSPVSATDPGGRALRLNATSRPSSTGTRRLTADADNYGLNTSLAATTLRLDVHPVSIGDDSWLDIVLETSYRPATGDRSAGSYTLTYRVGGLRPVGSRVLQSERQALVVIQARRNRWTALALDPVGDLNSFWPDVDFRDSALTTFSLAASSRQTAQTEVVVDGLQFERAKRTSDEVLAIQQALVDGYAEQFPTVEQHRGMEVSESTPHLGWLGNPQVWPASSPNNQDVALAVRRIRQAGGVTSYNHPYGSSGGPYSAAQRTTKRRSVTSTLVQERLFGADVLEVGYLGGRAGMQLADYLALWDVLSRNAVFATGVGTSDDHNGRDWLGLQWRCVTGVWAPGTGLDPLQRALLAGRAWFGDLAAFDGTINLLADGYVAMGEAALVDKERCTLDIEVTNLPPGWSAVLVVGEVDEAGPATADPLVTRRTFAGTDFQGAVLSVKVNTPTSRFFRVELQDAQGSSRAFSNPLWLLRQPPASGIPRPRSVTAPTSPGGP
jgi:hypothetical protein